MKEFQGEFINGGILVFAIVGLMKITCLEKSNIA